MIQKPNPLEKISIPEIAPKETKETDVEQRLKSPEQPGKTSTQYEDAGVISSVATALPVEPGDASKVAKDPETAVVELILAEGLEDLYGKMLPSEQEAFKKRGEEVALTIRQMMTSAKVKVKKVLLLIKGWLRMIPGVNQYFLDQEAKIKTDKILARVEKQRKEEIE